MQLIFDQGIGDIFNARVAGNFVNDASGNAAPILRGMLDKGQIGLEGAIDDVHNN